VMFVNGNVTKKKLEGSTRNKKNWREPRKIKY
jgi:hypothetical protein